MKRSYFSPPLAAVSAVFSLFLAFSPSKAGAAEIIVPKDHAHIQDAITAAVAGDIVTVETGTYQETFTLKEGVEVHGSETARTVLDGGGTGLIVTASGISTTSGFPTSIRNFTFINALVGIQAAGSTIDITNNVFKVGTTNNGTAIVISNSADTTITNNTFYGNNTAISRDVDLTINNDIFANNNAIEIVGSSAASTKIAYNDYFNNISSSLTGTHSVSGDPLFVDPASNDFHLQAGSPCINAGNSSVGSNSFDTTTIDIGAYGGPDADQIPFPVAGLTITSTTASSINLAWSPNKCYLAVGDYFVYYGYASGDYKGIDADSGTSPSPISAGPDGSPFTLMDLNPLARVPAAPVLDPPVVGDTTLTLSWTAVPNAAGYFVHYGQSSPGEFTIDAGNATSWTLTGLKNGQPYHLAVSAYTPAKYFIVVTAWDSTVIYESAFSSEVSTELGPPLESAQSNIQTEFPDVAVHNPGLQSSHGHCFIATAAYGSYFAPEVRILRSFRDRYLLTSGPGRLFVQWYYQHGPSAAAYLNAHPAYKPAVRAALMPVVGAALILTNTPPMFMAGVLLMIGSLVAFGFLRKRFSERSVPR